MNLDRQNSHCAIPTAPIVKATSIQPLLFDPKLNEPPVNGSDVALPSPPPGEADAVAVLSGTPKPDSMAPPNPAVVVPPTMTPVAEVGTETVMPEMTASEPGAMV